MTAAERVFAQEFAALAAAGFLDVEMHLRVKKDVKVKRVRMVVPEIKELTLSEPEERHLVAKLGTLERDKPTRYIIDLSLPKRPDGKFSITDIEVTFDPGSGKRESDRPGAAGDDLHLGGPRLHQRRGGQAHRRGADLRAEQEPASRPSRRTTRKK